MSSRSSSGQPSRWSQWKQTITIHQILEAAGLLSRFRNRGGRLVGPCPVHGGDNPNAFWVDRESRWWHCFTRCRGGDRIALAWHLCGQSWPRTAEWLKTLAASSVPEPTVPMRPSPASNGVRRKFRPFTRALRLDPAHPYLVRLGLAEATVAEFEAGAWSGMGSLEGTVAVRLHDLDGSPLGYAGRILDRDRAAREGRWRWPPSYPKSQLLYNWHRAQCHLASGLIVVEGFWSVMKLAQAGFRNVIALGGTVVTPPHTALLARAARVILMLDGDSVGAEGTQRCLVQRIHPQLEVVRPPPGQGPADLHEEELVQLLAPAIRTPQQNR